MKRLSLIFQELDDIENEEHKIQYLQAQGQNQAFMMLLKMSFDGPLVWDVPFGCPPFKENLWPDNGQMLYKEVRRFYIYLKDGVPNMRQMKREKHFQDLMESIHPDDAKLVVAVKDKRLPWKTVTAELVTKAFPGYIDMNNLPVLEKIGPNKGKRFSKEHKSKQSEGAKKMWTRRKVKTALKEIDKTEKAAKQLIEDCKEKLKVDDGQDVPV